MIRIIAGAWRGRRIVTPRGEDTRPAADAHREAVANALEPRLAGTRVLDAFAGSGAFGLECLSRGAGSAVLVELARPALEAIRRNVESLGAGDRVLVLAADAYRMRPPGAPFDVVFVAPPYPHFREKREQLRRLLTSLRGGKRPLLAESGVAVVQSDAADFGQEGVPGLVRTWSRRYGRTAFTFLEPGSPAEPFDPEPRQ